MPNDFQNFKVYALKTPHQGIWNSSSAQLLTQQLFSNAIQSYSSIIDAKFTI